MPQKAIIGDDLTGCMDAGIQLAKRGFAVYVIFDIQCIRSAENDNNAIVVDTESRNIPIDDSYVKVTKAIKKIHESGFRLIYKKVDSTLRGNIGKEIEAVKDSGRFDLVLFTPALPLSGRTTRNGIHYLDGRPVTESDLARDPFAPVSSPYIPDILKQQTSLSASIITLDTIRRGKGCVQKKLQQLSSKGCIVVSADAECEKDLDILAAAVKDSGLNILPCGSAGLFSSICKDLGNNINETVVGEECKYGCMPILVINGSPAKMSKLQILAAEKQGFKLIKLDSGKPERFEEVKTLILDELHANRIVVIDAAGEGKQEISLSYYGDTKKMYDEGEMIRTILSELVDSVCANIDLAGLVIFGGDTAMSICRRLGACSIKITGEVEPLVPAGNLITKDSKCLTVITKAGGFGSEDIIRNCVKYIKGEK